MPDAHYPHIVTGMRLLFCVLQKKLFSCSLTFSDRLMVSRSPNIRVTESVLGMLVISICLKFTVKLSASNHQPWWKVPLNSSSKFRDWKGFRTTIICATSTLGIICNRSSWMVPICVCTCLDILITDYGRTFRQRAWLLFVAYSVKDKYI